MPVSSSMSPLPGLGIDFEPGPQTSICQTRAYENNLFRPDLRFPGRSLSGRGRDGARAPAAGRLDLPGVGFSLQEEVARRVGHVEIDVERRLAQGADLEGRL